MTCASATSEITPTCDAQKKIGRFESWKENAELHWISAGQDSWTGITGVTQKNGENPMNQAKKTLPAGRVFL
jgi:hypothetical protein